MRNTNPNIKYDFQRGTGHYYPTIMLSGRQACLLDQKSGTDRHLSLESNRQANICIDRNIEIGRNESTPGRTG
jgi:hypothetical protein